LKEDCTTLNLIPFREEILTIHRKQNIVTVSVKINCKIKQETPLDSALDETKLNKRWFKGLYIGLLVVLK
jgi:hypothetical protein